MLAVSQGPFATFLTFSVAQLSHGYTGGKVVSNTLDVLEEQVNEYL